MATGFELIGRRRRPELDAQRAAAASSRGLPADLPLGELRSRSPEGCARKAAAWRVRRSRLAQSPPSTRADAPAAESTVLSCLASSLTASGSGLTSSNFRTCTLLSAGEMPLTRRSAPVVVLVVATLTPEASVERLEARDLGEGGDGSMVGGGEIDLRAALQPRAAGVDLHLAGAGQLADDDPLGAAQRPGEPAGGQ